MKNKKDARNSLALALIITAAAFTTVFIGTVAAVSIFLYKQFEKLKDLPFGKKEEDRFDTYDLSYDDDDDSWKVDSFSIDDEDIPF